MFLISLSTIHDEAEPVATSMMFSCSVAQPFQKFSNALTKSDRFESIHGISSIKTTLRLSSGSLPRYSAKASNASNQSANARGLLRE